VASSQYCTAAELVSLGIRAEAIRGISSDDLAAAIEAASDEIDSYLNARYVLPLVSWGKDVRVACARLAVYQLIVARGFNSARAGDQQLLEQHDMAERWLRGIANGQVAPMVTDSSTPATPGKVSGGVKVTSNVTRGYNAAPTGGGAFTGRRS
jgi:phage gp36-like protein